MSTLLRCPSSIFSADHGVAHPPRCPKWWFWRGCHGMWHALTMRVSVSSASQARSSCTSLLSPLSFSMAVRHWPCLMTLRKGSRLRTTISRGNFSASPTWRTKPAIGCGDQLSCWSTGTSSRNCQKTEICMVRTCHPPRQPLQNYLSGHLGGWATPWSTEEIPANSPCQNSEGPPSENTGRECLLNSPSCSSGDPCGS